MCKFLSLHLAFEIGCNMATCVKALKQVMAKKLTSYQEIFIFSLVKSIAISPLLCMCVYVSMSWLLVGAISKVVEATDNILFSFMFPMKVSVSGKPK